MGLGLSTWQEMKISYSVFLVSMVNSFNAMRFATKRFTMTATKTVCSYTIMIQNHVSVNYQKMSIRYVFTRLSSSGDEFYIVCSVPLNRGLSKRSIITDSTLIFREKIDLTDSQKAIVNNLVTHSTLLMGPQLLTEANVYAKPHQYLPDLWHVFQRMESKFISKNHALKDLLPKELSTESTSISNRDPLFVDRDVTHLYSVKRHTRENFQLEKSQDLAMSEKVELDNFVIR
ncbi:hypothetical protein BDB01DRAFT_876791 [Pilobolus umbonatus]|nr:hypothetical protein BDB01DRAFT_876791 [Pilobolus umbonatus]